LRGAAGAANGDTYARIDDAWFGGPRLRKWDVGGALVYDLLLLSDTADVVPDDCGNAHVLQRVTAPQDLGCGLPAGPANLTKVDASGACLWSRDLPLTTAKSWPSVRRIDATGGTYVSDVFQGTIDLGCG